MISHLETGLEAQSGQLSVRIEPADLADALVSDADIRHFEGTMALTPAGERDLSWSDINFPLGISPDGKQVILNLQSEQAGPDYLVGLRSLDG